jgi:hypothetical protein
VSDAAARVERLAGLWPRPVDPDPRLERALGYLDWGVDAGTVERAGRTLAAVVAGVAAAAGVAVGLVARAPRVGVAVTCAGVCLATLALALARRGPAFLAAVARTRALGAVPGLVGRAALRLRIDPAIERAAGFAARTGNGPLARSLEDHVRRADGTPRSGLDSFAAEWAERFPAVERAVARLDAASTAPEAERDRHLDRAVEAALDGAREDLAAFTDEIRGPVTGLYAFGVLLPLALVGVLPAARATGVRVSLRLVVAVYDVLLPAVVVGVGAWLLTERPVAFPPPDVDATHPETPDGAWRALLAGGVAGGVAAAVAWRVVAPWSAAVAAAGVGPGIACVVHFAPAKRVRERVRAVEADIADALYLVGRRVADGQAVETALDAVGDRLPDPSGALLDDAASRQRRLGLTVGAAFRGQHGVLADLPSQRTREVAGLFDLAATAGRPAGDALVTTATHFEELQRLEREARRDLGRTTDTLANTAAVFGPLVGGATVALSARVAATGAQPRFGAAPLPTAALGLAVGAYVLWLAVALTALSTGLARGFDRTLVGYRVGLALTAATCCYLAAYVGAGLFL